MHRIASLATRVHWVAALAIVAACQEDSVPADESETSNEGGINTLSGADTMMTAPTTADSSGSDTTLGTGGAPDCNDDAHNGVETDVDCGGSCDPCVDGAGCLIAEDCYSLVCEGGACQTP